MQKIVILFLWFLTPLAKGDFDALSKVPDPPAFLTFLPHVPGQETLNLNPGFYSEKSVYVKDSLQSCLDTGLKKMGAGQPKGRYGLAVVDLTGDKVMKPEFAHINSEEAMYGASQSKTGALIAAHQLLFDARALYQKLKEQGKGDLATLKAQVKEIYAKDNPWHDFDLMFQFDPKNPEKPLEFKESFHNDFDQMMRISNNWIASKVIKTVGFNFINSTLWQMGIYDPSRGGGLWVGRAYGGGQMWHRDPVANLSHGINPLSLAKAMTLIAQYRMINKEMSQSILRHLANTRFRIKFVKGLIRLGLKVNRDGDSLKDPTKKAEVYRKSGTMKGSNPISHDATIVKRTVCKDKECKTTENLRYVATGASRNSMTPWMWRFGQLLDRCVRENNGINI